MPRLVSIVLPVWNGASDLRALLPALRAQNFDGEIEIVAIDSASSDGSADLLRDAGARVWTIAQTEFGHGKTRNFGVAQSRGDVVVFLSQDACPVGENWLRDLIAPLENPRVGAVFARQLPRADASPLERAFHASVYPPHSRTTRPSKRAATVFFSNVCSATRRETALRFPFDESLIMSEDQLFGRALLQHGLSLVYAGRVEVVHSHATDLPALFKRNFDSGYSLRGFDSSPILRKLRRLAQFWGAQARHLARARQWRALGQMPLYEFTRLLAFLLGSQADKLPRALRLRLSQHRAFWKP